MAESRDLFDDSTMTFGEHLEVLRVHLIRALLGLVLAVIVSLYYGHWSVAVIRRPLDDALQRYGAGVSPSQQMEAETLEEVDFFGTTWNWMRSWWSDEEPPKEKAAAPKPEEPPKVEGPRARTIEVRVPVRELGGALHELDAEKFPKPADDEQRSVSLHLTSPAFADYDDRIAEAAVPKPISLEAQEAFMTYVKVSVITGLIISSPWIFYQTWLFVAAGLYPHERKYVYTYLPMSLGLFFGGILLCYFGVLPLVLEFLFGFNRWLKVEPNIQLTKWINFAIVLPVMFGISFQLPLVMLFLERISIFRESTYREQRRMAILVIAILSMLLTPADPASMLMMMFPLIFLYEFGILLCKWSPAKTPFEGAEPV
jgi:sec-independent protein translocase protein TatC